MPWLGLGLAAYRPGVLVNAISGYDPHIAHEMAYHAAAIMHSSFVTSQHAMMHQSQQHPGHGHHASSGASSWSEMAQGAAAAGAAGAAPAAAPGAQQGDAPPPPQQPQQGPADNEGGSERQEMMGNNMQSVQAQAVLRAQGIPTSQLLAAAASNPVAARALLAQGGGRGSGGGGQAAAVRLIRPDGSTLKMRGLPFRASPDEVLSFFKGYNYVSDTLYLGTDSLGRPSGEGWLTFDNPDEAKRALRERNRQYLGTRYIELTIC